MTLNRSYFVTGTDTGIGKTVVSTILARGLGAHYWKPVQTGSVEGMDSDFARLWVGPENVRIESYVYPDPVSPHLAAGRIGEEIDLARCFGDFLRAPRPLVVEGAGGVLVPLNRDHLMIDLMTALGLPVVIATSTRLGTINHTLMTIEILRSRRLDIAGVVMNGPADEGAMEAIASFGGVDVWGRVPPCAEWSNDFFDDVFRSFKRFSQRERELA